MIKRLISATILFFWVAYSVAWGVTPAAPKTDTQAKDTTIKKEITSNYKGKMELLQDSFDFGFAPQDCKISHIFWLKNIGTDSLEIINVKPG